MSPAERTPVVAIPELTPALLPIAALLGIDLRPWSADDPILPDARWPALRTLSTGLPDSDWASLPDATLWLAHDAAIEGRASRGGPSVLNVKIELARRLSDPCKLCFIRCGARREHGETGPCGATASASTRVWRERVLAQEEPFLRDGWAIDPSGCNANCAFCHSARGISGRAGVATSVEAAAASVDTQSGIQHLNIVGGESTIHLPWILQLLRALKSEDLPLVLTTNGGATPEVARVLRGVVSAYLVSARLTDQCATALGDIGHSQPLEFLRAAGEDAGSVWVVRLLAVPGHVTCCTFPWIESLQMLAPETAPFWVSPMYGYVPAGRARRMSGLDTPLVEADAARLEARLADSSLRLVHTDRMTSVSL